MLLTSTTLVLSLFLAPLQAGAKDAKKPPATYKDIEASFDDQEKRAQKDLQEKRFVAIEAYLNAKTPPTDREEALAAAAELSASLEKWDKSVTYSDKFLADFKTADNALQIQMTRARSLGHISGKTKLAQDAYGAIIDTADKNIGAAVEAATELADLLVEAGDVEAAKAGFDKVAEKYPTTKGLKEHLEGLKEDYAVIGQDPKPIDVKDLDGKPLSIAMYKGKVVMIDFWATWCGPCMQELPNVLAAYKKYHDKGFEIIGISLDKKEDEKRLRSTMAAKGMVWQQFYDGGYWKNAVAVDYGIQSIPATYLLDRNGKIIRKGLRGDALGRAVEKALAAPAKPAK